MKAKEYQRILPPESYDDEALAVEPEDRGLTGDVTLADITIRPGEVVCEHCWEIHKGECP